MDSDTGELEPETAAEIDRFVDDWRTEEGIPGVSLAVIDREGLRYAAGYGHRDLETEAAATPDTLYAVASITKPVTATAVLQLVERGALALDDEIREYVDVLVDVPGEPITVGELLAHASGMPRDFVAQRHLIDDGQDLDLFEHVEGAAGQRLLDRDRHMYYNAGYFALGEVIEAVDGRDYSAYVDAEVLEPLGMERSTFDPSVVDRDDDAMTGYLVEDGEPTPDSYDGGAGPAGGLLSSARELGRLLRFVLNDGELDGTRVLGADLVDAMTTRQSATLPTAVEGWDPAYGYGWNVETFAGELLVDHPGGIGVSGGYVAALPESGVGVAMGFNALRGPSGPIGNGVLAILRGERPEEVVPQLRAECAVSAVTGEYEAYRGATTATVEEGPARTIEVTLDALDSSFVASPDELGDGEYAFSFRTGAGTRWLVEFRETEADTELIVSQGKWVTVLHEV